MQVVAREELLLILKTVLSRHGAVPMSSSLVGYAGAETPAGAALLLDRSSSVLALRHEMRTPFAAWLARQASLSQNSTGCALFYSMLETGSMQGLAILNHTLLHMTEAKHIHS